MVAHPAVVVRRDVGERVQRHAGDPELLGELAGGGVGGILAGPTTPPAQQSQVSAKTSLSAARRCRTTRSPSPLRTSTPVAACHSPRPVDLAARGRARHPACGVVHRHPLVSGPHGVILAGAPRTAARSPDTA